MGVKRVVILADLHSGHHAGITPPAYHTAASFMPNIARLQRETWDWYAAHVKGLRPHLMIVNGDLIDGRGEKTGGSELITPDREQQVNIAATVLKAVNAKNIIITVGTPYHTGREEDFENLIARELGCEIHSHCWPVVNGVTFDCKHKIGGSQIPHGRHTAIARDRLWNTIWHDTDGQPRGDIIIRSHVHFFSYAGGADWLAITTPALQAANTRFGARQMSGTVDYGFLVFDIKDNGEYLWHPELLRVKNTVAKPIKF